uniref:EF-hand domain-containing protein n=1 Tax=Monodelphis domestica TaxID=13616 RepID=F7EH84_MONDO
MELQNFLRDLFQHHKKTIPEAKLGEYTDTMMKIFDKNKDGRLDLNDLARSATLRKYSGFRSKLRKGVGLLNSSYLIKQLFPPVGRKVYILINTSWFYLAQAFTPASGLLSSEIHFTRILALQENFLLQFKMDACSTEERMRDFEKIFAHYDVSKTGALEGPEVDGFVKDMMELVKPSISGVDLDKFREILLRHCDVNKDGKIQKSELALCLGLKVSP